jgi:PhnB protein
MATMNTYLNFMGNTEEAFNFYKSVFGGEFVSLQRFKDHPEACGGIPAAEQNGIMHVALPIGKSMLMGTDAVESMGQKVIVGNNISISLSVDSEKEADTLFNKLGAGGNAMMPLQKMFWNAYFGMLTDKFGIQWMVNYDYNQAK